MLEAHVALEHAVPLELPADARDCISIAPRGEGQLSATHESTLWGQRRCVVINDHHDIIGHARPIVVSALDSGTRGSLTLSAQCGSVLFAVWGYRTTCDVATGPAPEEAQRGAVVAVPHNRVRLVADVDAALDSAHAELHVLKGRLRRA